jgi:GT2 family glycosyltransferase
VTDLSIVAVRLPGGRPVSECLASLPDPDGYTVVDVVAVVPPGDTSVPSGARAVAVDPSAGFAVAVTRGVGAVRGHRVLVLPTDVELEPGWAAPMLLLLDRNPEVAAVTPQTRDLAGALVATAPLAAVATAAEIDDGADLFGCLLLHRSAFVAAGAIDAGARTPGQAGRALAGQWAELGWRVAYQPAARAHDRTAPIEGAAASHDMVAENLRLEPGALGPFDRILVVHDRVPGPSANLADRRVFQLLRQMRAVWPASEIVVAAVDGHRAGRHEAAMADLGIEVVIGPCDWTRWFEERRLTFSYIFATAPRLARRLHRLRTSSQPQATKVLWLGQPDFWAAQALTAIQFPEEASGLRTYEGAMAERLLAGVRWADHVWCCHAEDRDYLAAVAPGKAVSLVPFMGEPATARPLSDRQQFATLAMPEADVLAAHEDAAIAAVTQVLPLVHKRGVTPSVRVLTQEPSPAVQRLTEQGATMAWVGTNPAAVLARSRVCLAPYSFGTGGRWAVELAIATATPFVTTSLGARGVDLGDLRPLLVADDVTGLAQRALDLHEDDELWEHVHQRLAALAAAGHSEQALRRGVAMAGAQIGLVPAPDFASRVLPDVRVSNGHSVIEPAPGRMLRYVPTPREWPIDRRNLLPEIERLNDTAQYQLWLERNGPTTERLSSVKFAVDKLDYRPKISVVMPTYNTDIDVLRDSVESVLTQVYDNFELCIADDASKDDDTRALLERYAGHPKVKIAFLDENRGIAGATNAALELADGDFIGFLDHDDKLKPHALAEIARALNRESDIDVFYTDWDMQDLDGTLVQPFFKPGWSPDLFMSRNYICHFLVVRRSLLDEVGGLRLTFDGSQDYDLALRLVERTQRIVHLPDPLYTWRKVPGSVADDPDAKPYAFDAAKRALADALRRRGTPGEVCDGLIVSAYRVRYEVIGKPLVSIIIATRDRLHLLEPCVTSILEKSTYGRYEIVVVDNQSEEPETAAYFADFPGKVLRYDHPFNYARMMNWAAAQVQGDQLLFLNNDTTVITEDWMEALLEHAQRPEVGAVGGRLIYPDGRVQHEGIALGMLGGVAANIAFGGWWGNGDIVRNCSAVTGACLMVRPSVFWEVGGNDERLRVAYNDVDLGLRIRQAGYENVYTPYCRLFHFEGASRKGAEPSQDEIFFGQRWRPYEFVDQYYNPHLDPYRPFNIRLDAAALSTRSEV